MSSSSVNVFHDSSPHSSSGEVGSIDGTPDTRLTAFSPEARLGKHLTDKPIVNFSIDHASLFSSGLRATLEPIGSTIMNKDPFTSTGSEAKSEQKLSATASSFHPVAYQLKGKDTINGPIIVQSPGTAVTNCGPGSTTDTLGVNPSSPTSSHGSGVTQLGTFSTDTSVTRALKISGIYAGVVLDQVEACIHEIVIPDTATRRFFRVGRDVLIRFSDIQDAVNVYKHAKMAHSEWSVDYISPASFAETINPHSPYVSAHEGQVSLVARLPTIVPVDRAKIEDILVDLLGVDGTIYAFQKQLATEAGTIKMVIEFSDVNSAVRSIERLNGATVRGISFKVSLHKPDLEKFEKSTPQRRGSAQMPLRPPPDLNELLGSLNGLSLEGPPTQEPVLPYGYAAVLSPTGRSFVTNPYPMPASYSGLPVTLPSHLPSTQNSTRGFPTGSPYYTSQFGGEQFLPGGLMRYPDYSSTVNPWNSMIDSMHMPLRGGYLQNSRYYGRRPNLGRGNTRSPYSSGGGQHNVVDIERIRQGLDVRTTIMLRNIPNKINQQMLKDIIDETSFGLYDFMYLRIDFANNCNVGYAFINFEDPWHIINFVQARAGQGWNRYNSDKVAEVSYATIQGKDCLVQKFRNSSVMLEHPSFRPKIFYTGSHPLAGQEEDFPLPDNASKMRRSVENAEHVGLFAPRAGQHYRDEQRRRRSQYDRGTRLAALEEDELDDLGRHHYDEPYIY